MNEQEQMMQIISAISEKTGEAPEKVVAMLQEIMQKEGQEGVKAFIDKMLNPEAEMFRKGGKMEAAVNKFQRGGVYNRAQGRQNKRDAGIDYDTEMADYTARGSEVRQMSYHRPTLNNHTMPEGYVVPQQGVGVESMYVPAERLMGFLGLKKGGKINKCQGGRSFGDDGIKRVGVYFDDKTGHREFADSRGRYMRTTFPNDTIWSYNDYGTDRTVYTTPNGRVGYIDDIYGNRDTLSSEEMKRVVDAIEARMKHFTKDERRNYVINRYGDEMLMPENKSSKDKKKK